MALIDPESCVVCDAGPLIHLDELSCLDLLSDFAALLVPETVWGEVEHHRPGGLKGTRFMRISAGEGPASPNLAATIRAFGLDAGEREALLLLLSRPGSVFLTDDAAARLAARSLGFRAHGSLGILLRAIRRGQRTREEVLALLREIPKRSSLHVRSRLLQDIIEEVEHEGGNRDS